MRISVINQRDSQCSIDVGERNASQLRDGPEQLLIGLELISGGQYLLRLYPENNRNSIIIYTYPNNLDCNYWDFSVRIIDISIELFNNFFFFICTIICSWKLNVNYLEVYKSVSFISLLNLVAVHGMQRIKHLQDFIYSLDTFEGLNEINIY